MNGWGKDLYWRMRQRLKLLTMMLLTLTDCFSCALPRHPQKFTAGNFLWMPPSVHFSLTQHLPSPFLCLLSLSWSFLPSLAFLRTNPTSPSKEIITLMWSFSLISMTPAFRTSAFLCVHHLVLAHHPRTWSCFWKASGTNFTGSGKLKKIYRKGVQEPQKHSVVKQIILCRVISINCRFPFAKLAWQC